LKRPRVLQRAPLAKVIFHVGLVGLAVQMIPSMLPHRTPSIEFDGFLSVHLLDNFGRPA